MGISNRHPNDIQCYLGSNSQASITYLGVLEINHDLKEAFLKEAVVDMFIDKVIQTTQFSEMEWTLCSQKFMRCCDPWKHY
jgi:hypothetical protein